MIRRKKTTIFTDAKESTPMGDVKKIIDGILKVPPENQRLYKDDTVSPEFQTRLWDFTTSFIIFSKMDAGLSDTKGD